MIAKSLLYCLFIPVTLLAALFSDTEIRSKFVCIGNTDHVFQNIISLNYTSRIILYKTHSNESVTIAEWYMQNVSDTDILPLYRNKFSLETENGTILIKDFQISDEATYLMFNDSSKEANVVQLLAAAPPTKCCKMDIRQEEYFLIVSLDDPEYCGRPLASVHWMENSDILNKTKTIINGTEGRTYRACIEGEALTCMIDSAEWNNCKNYTIRSIKGNDCPTPVCDQPQTIIAGIETYVIVILSLVVTIIVGFIAYLLCKRFGLGHKITETERSQKSHQQLQQEENNSGIDLYTTKATILIEDTTETSHYTKQILRKKEDTEGIYTYMMTATSSNVNVEDSPSERRLLYIILGMGAIVAAAFIACLLHKIKICFRGVRCSNIRTVPKSDDGNENIQEVNQAEYYWTIVSNANDEMSTAIDTGGELSRELPLVRPIIIPTSSESDESMRANDRYVSQEIHRYSNPINSCTMEFNDYIHPIHSTPLNTYMLSKVKESQVCNMNMSIRRDVKALSI